MDLSARDIHSKQFHDAWRGYNQEEVDDFLDRVAEALDRIQRENTMLQKRVHELEQAVATSREAEEMLKKTLVTAQQAAEEAISKAKAKAEQLVVEAEERAKQARDETRERIAAAEVDIRRKTMDAERDYSQRRRELDSGIERLRAFETELKQRLRAFLDQQLKSLEALTEREPPSVRTQARPAAAAPQRPVAAPSVSPGQTHPQREEGEEGEERAAPVEAEPQRRSVRHFFGREG